MTLAAIKANRERDTCRIVDDMEEPITAIKGLLPIAHGMLEPEPREESDPKGAINILHAILLLVEKVEEDRAEVLKRLRAETRVIYPDRDKQGRLRAAFLLFGLCLTKFHAFWISSSHKQDSPMADGFRARSVVEAIRPFRWRIAVTYALTVTEDLLALSYPWATGIAINGLLAQDYRMIAPVMIAWLLHTAIGCGRQLYDTRLYTKVYNAIVIDTVMRQRQAGIEPTKVAARSAMSREFVTFFEKDMPVVLNTLVSIVGSAAILFYYDLVIGAVAASQFIPVAILNRSYMRRSLFLNEGLNNELEHEVQVIDAAQEGAVTRHFNEVRTWRVKLSDADAFNWTAIEVLSILVFLLVLLRVTYMPNVEVGTIFAIFVYVWHVMEKLDMMPTIVQQLMRLKDIRRRIEAGNSIEAIGELIQRTDKSSQC
jgi:hypothetical protein